METLEELENRLKNIEETANKKELEQELAEALKDYKGNDEVIPFSEYKNERPFISFSTGLDNLDEMLSGFHEGDLVVITGPRGEGKTTLLLTFTINLARQEVKSLWFSYEVSTANLIRNFKLACEDNLIDGYVPKILFERSIVWIERKIVEAIVKFGVKAVFIDPFNSLSSFSSVRLSQELGDLAEKLKQIAIKYNIILFLSAHARKLTSDEVIYSADTIRDTGLLASKADTIIAFWRQKKGQSKKELEKNGIIYENKSMLSLVKNRFSGKMGNMKLLYANNKFLSLEEYDTE